MWPCVAFWRHFNRKSVLGETPSRWQSSQTVSPAGWQGWASKRPGPQREQSQQGVWYEWCGEYDPGTHGLHLVSAWSVHRCDTPQPGGHFEHRSRLWLWRRRGRPQASCSEKKTGHHRNSKHLSWTSRNHVNALVIPDVGVVQSVQWLCYRPGNWGSVPDRGNDCLLAFVSPPRPDRLRGPPTLLCSGYRGYYAGGKATGAWSWPLTSM
jgi:hypothetical protein